MLNALAQEITEWREEKGFETSWQNMPEKLMLVVTEVSEAMEAYRKIDLDEPTDQVCKPPQIYRGMIPLTNFAEEIADTFIRLLDITGALNIDIEEWLVWKMYRNNMRPHKHGKNC